MSAVDIFVSSQRISYYLFSEEIDRSIITLMDPEEMAYRGGPAEKTNGVIVKNGNFFWKYEELNKIYEDEKKKAFKKGKSKQERKLKKMKKGRNL